jgi:phosphocarrier protein FPr
MLKLTTKDIALAQTASNKIDAIRAIATDLTNKGMVASDYVNGMLDREAQASTYLGNGIAIPHGTIDTRGLVNNTGVTVHHFAHGVDWGDGNTIYVAIGIAAKSDEHLAILKQLTKVLSADGVDAKLKTIASKQQLLALLNGDVQFDIEFNKRLIQRNFPSTDMLHLTAVSSGLLKNANAADSDFVAELIATTPTYLGKGLWLVSGTTSVSKTAMSIVTVAEAFLFEDKPVNTLIALSICNSTHEKTLDRITQLVFDNKQASIYSADEAGLLSLFSPQEKQEDGKEADGSESGMFMIKNTHGLHARPGAMLVAEAKKFESIIKVKNVDGEGKTVNAKSLMKVIGLGVKHGHKLEFTAQGVDASQAITSIGRAIESGLGEG